MKTKLIFGLLIICLLISGCDSTGNVVKDSCNKPYIYVGGQCCLDSNSNNICDNDETPLQKENVENKLKCIDSDGGKDSYIQGVVTGFSSMGTVAIDECKDSNTLKEYICDDIKAVGYNVVLIPCPNGCKDGACLGETEIQQLKEYKLYANTEELIILSQSYESINEGDYKHKITATLKNVDHASCGLFFYSTEYGVEIGPKASLSNVGDKITVDIKFINPTNFNLVIKEYKGCNTNSEFPNVVGNLILK